MKAEKNTRENILSVALSLFAARGYESAGVAEIVNQAGVTKPTLYYFFGSKEGLLDAVLAQYYTPLLDQLKTAARYEPHLDDYEMDVRPTLLRCARLMLTHSVNHRESARLILRLRFAPMDAPSATQSARLFSEMDQVFMEMFQSFAAAHGNMRGRERPLAECFQSLLFGAAERFLLRSDADEMEIEGAADALTRIFMHGIFS